MNAIEREERRAEMIRLRTADKWTYEMIGRKFGVTRERVRQILGRAVPHAFYREYTKYDSSVLYDFILSFKSQNDGNSPTCIDILRNCDVSSTSVVWNHLRALERQGKIELVGNGKSRMIRVVGAKWLQPTEAS